MLAFLKFDPYAFRASQPQRSGTVDGAKAAKVANEGRVADPGPPREADERTAKVAALATSAALAPASPCAEFSGARVGTGRAVAGVTTEYTGMKFAIFLMAEYIHTLVASAVGAALFLGGWDGPVRPGLHWMVLKTLVLFAGVYWIRWSLLRFRSDQLMGLCWKYLVPAGVLLVGAAAAWVVLR